MILLDTTVLVYAVGAEHPLREPCRALIRAISAREIEATTTAEVVQEFAHVRARRRDRAEAATLAADYVALLAPLAEVSAATLGEGLRLFAGAERIGALDAVLAALAKGPSITALVSADRAFQELDGVPHVFPDGAGVERLLSGAR